MSGLKQKYRLKRKTSSGPPTLRNISNILRVTQEANKRRLRGKNVEKHTS